jgi:phenylpyruvate tautomerase PptA (4-oxalocrotonate tautomerase family)
LPTVDVNLFDTKVTLKQKQRLAELLTRAVSETLGSVSVEITIVFTRSAKNDVARGGKLGKS